LSVNVGRAIPDVSDGLRPGNRRILYAMKELGLTKSRSYTKCAKVVGEVIGNYHPHGDSSVYDTMVRMAQDFAMRTPLIDGQGNFGSIDGDPAAAYRYTECRMERVTETLLTDIEKNTVDMMPTFDESTLEPKVLPARFPNLLVNGTTGIGVGMATNTPPHNLKEVIDATVHLLENPAAGVPELMTFLPGPDFPTGATICGISEIRKFYETGHGVVKVRAKAEIIEKNNKEMIIVTEIPYAVNKEMLVKKIADLVNEKKITGISALRDESSNRAGIRIVIEIKRGSIGEIVLNQLYAHTSLSTSFGCNMLVVDHNRPKVMNLPQVLQAYIDHRHEVVVRRTKFELAKAEARAHILEGLLIAVDNIDEVVSIIRASRTKDEAASALITRFDLSKKQTAAILDMRLHQLTGLAMEDIQSEYDELLKTIQYLKDLLASRELRVQVIKDELIEVAEKFSNPRRTEITAGGSDIDIADLIPKHNCVITVSSTGYIKRVPSDTYRTQRRGGKGVIGMSTKDEDFVEHLFNAHSHDLIFFITDKGVMHWLNVYDIPEGSRTSNGKAIVNMLKVEPGEKIQAMITLKRESLEDESLFLLMATKSGYVKKTSLTEFKNLRKAGIRAITIGEDDDLVKAVVTNGEKEVLLSTAKGMACRFDESQVRAMGRTARGVTGIRLKLENDYVVSMLVVDQQPEIDEDAENIEEDQELEALPQILVISDGGMGKRSLVSSYRKTKRGAKGVVSIKLREGEDVIAASQVEDGDELMLTTEKGQMVRFSVDEVRTVGRASKGVRIMRFKNEDKITSVAKIAKDDISDDEELNAENVDGEDGAETTVDNAEQIVPETPAENADVSEVLKDVLDTED
jgi:DNA gyrase subunit A